MASGRRRGHVRRRAGRRRDLPAAPPGAVPLPTGETQLATGWSWRGQVASPWSGTAGTGSNEGDDEEWQPGAGSAPLVAWPRSWAPGCWPQRRASPTVQRRSPSSRSRSRRSTRASSRGTSSWPPTPTCCRREDGAGPPPPTSTVTPAVLPGATVRPRRLRRQLQLRRPRHPGRRTGRRRRAVRPGVLSSAYGPMRVRLDGPAAGFTYTEIGPATLHSRSSPRYAASGRSGPTMRQAMWDVTEYVSAAGR